MACVDLMADRHDPGLDPVIIAQLSTYHDKVPFRARPAYSRLHHTWAQTFSSLPELFIQPESEAEVIRAIDLARRCRRRIATTGAGHSPSHITCTSSWLINLDGLGRFVSADTKTGLVVVEAGIRLYNLRSELARHGLEMPMLGSIDEQSLAGAFATGTHGSSLRHGLLSDCVTELRIALSTGELVTCSPSQNLELFRAALVSLGALGIVTRITFRAVPAFAVRCTQRMVAEDVILRDWANGTLWTQADYVRVYWFPYIRRAQLWTGNRTDIRLITPPDTSLLQKVGKWVHVNGYEALLYLGLWFPQTIPWTEWLVNGLVHGFFNVADDVNVDTLSSTVLPASQAFMIDCPYLQYVNEWAFPLRCGPDVIGRMAAWLRKEDAATTTTTTTTQEKHARPVPFPIGDLRAHGCFEIRCADSRSRRPGAISDSNFPGLDGSFSANAGSPDSTSDDPIVRPYLDQTCTDEPTAFINIAMFRPYEKEPPAVHRRLFFGAFDWIMRDVGGRPHWAKNFVNAAGVDDYDYEHRSQSGTINTTTTDAINNKTPSVMTKSIRRKPSISSITTTTVSARPLRNNVEAFESMYGADLEAWRRVRDQADSLGMFSGVWHRDNVLRLDDPVGDLEEVAAPRGLLREWDPEEETAGSESGSGHSRSNSRHHQRYDRYDYYDDNNNVDESGARRFWGRVGGSNATSPAASSVEYCTTIDMSQAQTPAPLEEEEEEEL